jgi:flagellar basal body-associated protein FliL
MEHYQDSFNFGGKNMIRLNSRILMSVKILLVTMLLLAPVGIVMAMDDTWEPTDNQTTLPYAKKTTELGFEPIEIVAKRTAVSKTFDKGDGSYRAEIYVQPIHYQDATGAWLDLDPSQPYPGSRSRVITEIQPDGNIGKDSFILTGGGHHQADQRRFNIGADPDFWISLDTSVQWVQARILIQFDISSIPVEADINDAALHLQFYDDNLGNQNSFTMSMYNLQKPWTEGTGLTSQISYTGVTWNTTDGTTPWTAPGGDYDNAASGQIVISAFGSYSGSFTNLFKEWLTGTKDNNGLILIGTSGADSVKYIRTSDFTTTPTERPKLVVDFISNHPPKVKNAIAQFTLDEDDVTKYWDLGYHAFNAPFGIFEDPDSDPLTFSIWTGTKWSDYLDGGSFVSDNLTAKIDENGRLEVTPKPNKFGVDNVRLNASDNQEFVTHQVNIIITGINDAPKINQTTKWAYSAPEPAYTATTITCQEDTWVNFTVTAWDPIERGDDEKLRYYTNASEDNAPFFSIEENTGKVSFLPENDDVGIYYLNVTVNDQGEVNNIAEREFVIEVENVNDNPVFTELVTSQYVEKVYSDTTEITLTDNAVEDKYYNFTVYAEDEDTKLLDSEESLIISIKPMTRFKLIPQSDKPKKIVVISFLPTNEDVGVFTAQLTVTDQALDETTIELNINVINMNDPPMVTNFYYGTQIHNLDEKRVQTLDLEELGKVYTATEREAYVFSVKAADIDLGDELEFEVEVENRTNNEQKNLISFKEVEDILSSNLVTSSIEITVTPDLQAGMDGEIRVNITVKDKRQDEGVLVVIIPVENVNDAPPESSIQVDITDADRTTRYIPENLTVEFSAENVSDPDGDTLIYIWDFDDSDGIAEDARGLDVIWTYPDTGTYTVTLIVDDSEGATNLTTKTIEVVKPPKKKSDDGDDAAASFGGEVIGIPVLYLIIVIVVIVVILLVLFMVMRKKKKEREEEEARAAEAEQQAQMQAQQQAQMMEQYQAQYQAYQQQQQQYYQQDPAAMAQYQQQMMQQYPEQYKQMMMQYGYDEATIDQYMQQMQAQQGTDMSYQQSEVQSMPMQSATLAEGQDIDAGLPAGSLGDQPQLPPAGEVEQPEVPESPYASAETQTLEEELGADAEVAEVPIEPDTAPPEPEIQPDVAPSPEEGTATEPQPTVESAGEGEGEAGAAGEVTGEKCKNCGNPVKEGWFLCPECKQPLV